MTGETTAIMDQIGHLQRSLNELKASLADSWARESVPSGPFEVFICRARDERFGLPIEAVEEVLPMCALTEYPQGPPWLSGVLNLRGEMIPVVDVAARIARTRRPIRLDDFIVVLEIAKKRFGLVFQEVFRIHSVDGAEVQAPVRDVPEALYVIGMVEVDKHPLFLLSIACLLGTSDIPEDLL